MSKHGYQRLSIGLGVLFAIFLVDAFFELGSVGPIPVAYLVACIAMLWFLESRVHIVLVAMLTSLLISVGYFLAPPSEHTDSAVLDHISSVCSLWLAVVIALRLQRTSEKEVERTKQLSALFVNSTEGILFVDQKGSITAVNPACERMFGYEHGEMEGMVVENLVDKSRAASHVTQRNLFFQDPRNRPMGSGREFSARRKDGFEFPVEISLSHFKTGNELSAVAFVQNISERKRQADNLRTQAQQLERAVRERTHDLTLALSNLESANRSLEQEIGIRNVALEKLRKAEIEMLKTIEKERELNSLKSRFVTMASHEFRTPLTTILSSTYLLNNYRGQDLEKFKSNHLSRIERSVKTMTQLLDEFLSLGKLDEGKLKPEFTIVELKPFITDLIVNVHALRKEGQQIQLTFSGANHFRIDRNLLGSIITNLLSNALKYSKENATIQLRVRQTPIQLEVEVQDAGIGIPDSEQRHIFKRFYRANNATNIGGTGLGLNIAKKYVRLMKGSIGFTSKLNEGTTFWVHLPLTMETAAHKAVAN